MAPDRKVRHLREEEKEEHLNMLNLCFNPWGDKQEWENKYIQPNFDVTRNILVIEEDGKWIGGGSVWWRTLLIGENKVKACNTGDVYTHPEHTGKGVFSTAEKSMNKLAQKKGAALVFGFISPQETPFVALPRYGFCDIFYPDTKIKLLKPERMVNLLDGEKIKILERFEGTNIKIATNEVAIFFIVKGGLLQKVSEPAAVDIIVKSDFQTLFRVYAKSIESKKAFMATTTRMILKRKLSIQAPFRTLLKIFKEVLRW